MTLDKIKQLEAEIAYYREVLQELSEGYEPYQIIAEMALEKYKK